MPNRQRNIYYHLGIGLALAISALVVVAGMAAQRQDRSSLTTQRDVVKYETRHLFAALRGKLQPQIYWQEAFDKTVLTFDPKWAAYQFGNYLDSQGINGVLLFDQSGKLMHLYTQGMKEPLRASQLRNSTGLVELRALAMAAPSSMPPVIKTGMVEIGGKPYFAAAGQIVPEDGKFLKLRFDKRVAVFLVEASTASYATLTASFDISDLTVGHKPHKEGLANVALTSATGKPVTYLWWEPQKPGHSFLGLVIPLTFVVFIILAATQTAIIKRWQSLQRALFSAEAKRQAAEEESRAKSVFLGTISHELRTPLNAILGFSEILGKAIFGPLGSPCYEGYVADIRKSGHDLLNIVDDLLEVARIDADDRRLAREDLDVSRIATDIVRDHRGAAREKKLELTTDIAESLTAHGHADALAQIIARVLSNAIKFCEPGSSIHVAAARKEEGCEIAISDNGPGIGEELLARIYQPFAQAEGHMTRKHGGMGLGLPIARALAIAMGSSLNIRSKLGHGTLVTMQLAPPQLAAGKKNAQIAA